LSRRSSAVVWTGATRCCKVCQREPAQEGAVSLLSSARRCDHITPLMRQLHWLPVQRRVEFKIACLVHQTLASLAPTYLTTDIHLISEYGRRLLRSSTDKTLTVPRTQNRLIGDSLDRQKFCCCETLSVEQFAVKSATDD